MKCPIKKCYMDNMPPVRRCEESEMNDPCDVHLSSDLRRALRLIREADSAMWGVSGSKKYQNWKRRAVKIGAIKEKQ